MKRTVLFAAPALALALVLSGCSSDDTGASNTTSTAGANTNDSSANGSTGAVKAENVLARMASSTSGKDSASVTMTVSGAQSLRGSGSMQFGSPAKAEFVINAEIDGESQEITMRLIDNTIYFGMPVLQAATGKEWIKISADGDDEISQSMKPLLEQMTNSADFSSNLEFLQAGTTVEQVGTAKVDGVDTTKFKLTTDVAKAASAAPESQKDLIKELQTSGVKELVAYVWIDGNDLPVKYEQTVEVAGQSMVTSMRYTSWGEPVNVEAPPASEVGDLSALLGSQS